MTMPSYASVYMCLLVTCCERADLLALNIILKENEQLIADQTQVCERTNTFYVNIAQSIGIDCNTPVNEEHPSIIKIKENANVSDFEFSPVTESQVENI